MSRLHHHYDDLIEIRYATPEDAEDIHEITRIDMNHEDSNKSFVIRITDKELLEKTGGIVQGMSGSPLIQNDKLVGAVTHVFVGDPHRGYAIYIEWMLNESDNLS